MIWRIIIMSIFLCVLPATLATAAPQTESQNIDSRAKQVGLALRCVVCQNQSIEESDADLAKDMRQIVRQRIENGESNADVIEFMRSRYGDYVLLKPPVQRNTYVLWFFPFVALLFALLWYVRHVRRPEKAEPVSGLSEEEKQALNRIINEVKK